MLYLIGGAPRCGKTTLGQALAKRLGIGWLSTDTVRDVVNMLMPELYESGGPGVAPDREADMLFPYFERVAESCDYLAESYLIEGVGFMPRHVASLASPIERRVVFVGMIAPDLDEILRHEGRNRWHRHLEQPQLEALPEWIASYSETLRADCDSAGMAYVDLSNDFDDGIELATQTLLIEALG